MPSEKLPERETPERRQRPVAEREPLTIVVLDTPPQTVSAPTTVERRVRTQPDVEIPAEAPRRRWPYTLLLAVAAMLLFGTYRTVFKPVGLRFLHGIERRVVGERSYNPPSAPKTKWPQD